MPNKTIFAWHWRHSLRNNNYGHLYFLLVPISFRCPPPLWSPTALARKVMNSVVSVRLAVCFNSKPKTPLVAARKQSASVRWPWMTLKVIQLSQGLQMEFVEQITFGARNEPSSPAAKHRRALGAWSIPVPLRIGGWVGLTLTMMTTNVSIVYNAMVMT